MTELINEYAEALFELAREENREKEFSDALGRIKAWFGEFPEYAELLSSPNIPIRERREIAEAAFGADVPEYVMSFVQLLCEKGHIRKFGNCADEYEKLYASLKGVSNARIVSAVELTEGEKKKLSDKLEKLSGHTVIAEYETDKSVIGGMIIYIDDKIIDGSVRGKLNDVKEVIGK